MLDSHSGCVSSNKQFYRQQLGVSFNEELGQLPGSMYSLQQLAILQTKDNNISSWLFILPLA